MDAARVVEAWKRHHSQTTTAAEAGSTRKRDSQEEAEKARKIAAERGLMIPIVLEDPRIPCEKTRQWLAGKFTDSEQKSLVLADAWDASKRSKDFLKQQLDSIHQQLNVTEKSRDDLLHLAKAAGRSIEDVLEEDVPEDVAAEWSEKEEKNIEACEKMQEAMSDVTAKRADLDKARLEAGKADAVLGMAFESVLGKCGETKGLLEKLLHPGRSKNL